MSAETHEVRPLENRCLFRDLLDLAAFCKHVADPDRSGQLVSDARYDDILYLCVFADRLDLVIELIESDHHHGSGHVEVILYLFLSRKRMYHVGNCANKVDRV